MVERSSSTGGVAVVGIGETPMSKAAPDSALEMAVDVCLAALADAGVEPKQVDGLLRFGAPYETVSHAALARNLGLGDVGYYAEVPLGGEGAAGMVHQAVSALRSGSATTVLAYRSIKQSGGNRMGRADKGRTDVSLEHDIYAAGDDAYTNPYWMLVPTHLFALWASRYIHEAGISEAQFREATGRIAVDQRRYANNRPTALMYERTLSPSEFEAGRMISWPLNLFMICLENDGAAAVVLTTAERAADLPAAPVSVLGSSQSVSENRLPYCIYADDLLQIFPEDRARGMWSASGLVPGDVDVAQMYDASSIMTLLSLELFGFCDRGTAWERVIADGLGLDSPLPINTHGGHLSDGYIHGMSGILEAVKQVRGTAINQVPDAKVSFFGAVSGSSALFASPDVAASLQMRGARA